MITLFGIEMSEWKYDDIKEYFLSGEYREYENGGTVVSKNNILDSGTTFNPYLNKLTPKYAIRKTTAGVGFTIKVVDEKDMSIFKERFKIDKIIYNEAKGATTVIFNNKDVVVVKQSEGTKHDIYSAVSAAIVKYIYGSNTAFKKELEKVEVI